MLGDIVETFDEGFITALIMQGYIIDFSITNKLTVELVLYCQSVVVLFMITTKSKYIKLVKVLYVW